MAQAKQEGARAQRQKDSIKAQQDTQASLAADVKKLKDAATKAANAKTATTNAAAAKIVAEKAAAARTVRAESQTTQCGGTSLSVGTNTTCAFARNVADAYYGNGGGTTRFDVYSPATGRYYTMNCTSGVPTVCRGGNNAVVYIR
jgi:serine/threonine-protein kinase